MSDLQITTTEMLFSDLAARVAEESMVQVGQFTDEHVALISDSDQDDKYLFPWLSSKSSTEREILLQAAHRSAYTAGQIITSEDGSMVPGPELELLARLRAAGTVSRIIFEDISDPVSFYTLLHYWHADDFVLQEIVRQDGIHDVFACSALRALEVIFHGLDVSDQENDEVAEIFEGSLNEFNKKRTELLSGAVRTAFITFYTEGNEGITQCEVFCSPDTIFLLRESADAGRYVIETTTLEILANQLVHNWFGIPPTGSDD